MFFASTLSAMSLAILVSLGVAPSRSLAQSVIPANPVEPATREPVSSPEASTSDAESSEATSPSLEPAPLGSPDVAAVETANYSDGDMSLD